MEGHYTFCTPAIASADQGISVKFLTKPLIFYIIIIIHDIPEKHGKLITFLPPPT